MSPGTQAMRKNDINTHKKETVKLLRLTSIGNSLHAVHDRRRHQRAELDSFSSFLRLMIRESGIHADFFVLRG